MIEPHVVAPRPPGYQPTLFYGVTDEPAQVRGVGITTDLSLRFLEESVKGGGPWCCFASITEPHDPFITGSEAYALYDVPTMALTPNLMDDLEGRPGLYRKAGAAWRA